MTKGYWVIRVDVTKPEQFKAYAEANGSALKKYGAKFLARAGNFENPEGNTRSRNTLVEFPSYQVAIDLGTLLEYQGL